MVWDLSLPEIGLLYERHVESLRMRDLYEARKSAFLLAALTDPKRRREIRMRQFFLIPERRRRGGTAKDLYHALRDYQAMRNAAKGNK